MLIKVLHDLAASGKAVDLYLSDRQTYVSNVVVLEVSQGACKIRCEEISEDNRAETWEWIIRLEAIASVGERVAIAPSKSNLAVTEDCPDVEKIPASPLQVVGSPFADPQIFADSDGQEIRVFGVSYPAAFPGLSDQCPLAYQANKEPVAICLGSVGAQSLRLIHDASSSDQILVIFSREGSPIFECCPENEIDTVIAGERRHER